MPSYIKDWNWVIAKIRTLASDPDRCRLEIRTVMVHGREWYHYATCVFAPSRLLESDAKPLIRMIYPEVALLAKEIPVHADTTYEEILTAIQTWEDIGEVPTSELRQDSAVVSVYFDGSRNLFGELPVWTLTVGSQSSMGFGSTPLLDPQLPLYDDVVDAASDWLRDTSILINQRPFYACRFVLTASNAFIKELKRNEDNTLNISIDMLRNRTDMVLKLKLNKADGTVYRPTLPVVEKVITCQLPDDVVGLSVYLIDQDAELHDFFVETQYRSTWNKSILNPQHGLSDRTLIEVVTQGEGETTEFKAWVPPDSSDNKFQELLQSVIAFSNTKGGRIFIGVNNNGEIIGVQRDLQKQYRKTYGNDMETMLRVYQQKLILMIRDSVEPDVNFRYEEHQSGGHIVVVIEVIEGKKPPYCIVQSNDYYIRRGASNRKPSPQELKALIGTSSDSRTGGAFRFGI